MIFKIISTAIQVPIIIMLWIVCIGLITFDKMLGGEEVYKQ